MRDFTMSRCKVKKQEERKSSHRDIYLWETLATTFWLLGDIIGGATTLGAQQRVVEKKGVVSGWVPMGQWVPETLSPRLRTRQVASIQSTRECHSRRGAQRPTSGKKKEKEKRKNDERTPHHHSFMCLQLKGDEIYTTTIHPWGFFFSLYIKKSPKIGSSSWCGRRGHESGQKLRASTDCVLFSTGFPFWWWWWKFFGLPCACLLCWLWPCAKLLLMFVVVT